MKKIAFNILLVSAIVLIGASCSKKATAKHSSQENARVEQRNNSGEKRPRGKRGEAPNFSELLSKMDANKDGKLAQTEVKGPLKDNFSTVDQNGDGFITEEEMKNAPRPQRGGGRGRN